MGSKFKGRAYTGHGPVIEDGPGRIGDYIKHRKSREKQVLDAMRSDIGPKGSWTAMEITKVVYRDVPENLHDAACAGVLQILGKLQVDGIGPARFRWGQGPAAPRSGRFPRLLSATSVTNRKSPILNRSYLWIESRIIARKVILYDDTRCRNGASARAALYDCVVWPQKSRPFGDQR